MYLYIKNTNYLVSIYLLKVILSSRVKFFSFIKEIILVLNLFSKVKQHIIVISLESVSIPSIFALFSHVLINIILYVS